MISVAIFITLCVIYLIKYINYVKPPLLGLYRRKNAFYSVKFAVVYAVLYVKWFCHLCRAWCCADRDHCADGMVTRRDQYLDTLPTRYHNKSTGGVLFDGAADNGDAILCHVTRTDGKQTARLILMIADDDYLTPEFQVESGGDHGGTYEGGGLKIYKLIAMRAWRIQYDGNMERTKDKSTVRVSLKVTWSTERDRFHYNTESSIASVARSVAKETWCKGYFRLLERACVEHTEQFGQLSGVVTIDNDPVYLTADCMKTHTFGSDFNCKTIHRSVHHIAFTKNGEMISIINVSHPVTVSQLDVGFVHPPARTPLPVAANNLHLFRHAEHLPPPTDYAFIFTAGGKEYLVQVHSKQQVSHRACDSDLYVVHARSRFTVNGQPGWGLVRWVYRNNQ